MKINLLKACCLLFLVFTFNAYAQNCEYRNALGKLTREMHITQPQDSADFVGDMRLLVHGNYSTGLATWQGQFKRSATNTYTFTLTLISSDFAADKIGAQDTGMFELFDQTRLLHWVNDKENYERVYQQISCQ